MSVLSLSEPILDADPRLRGAILQAERHAEAGSANRPERTLCRQSCTCWGRQPWRRAVSVTTAPGSRLSATLCTFSSSGQRFRPTPAHTSIRDDNGRLMSSEWSSIVSTLAEDDSSNGAPKPAYRQSQRSLSHAYVEAVITTLQLLVGRPRSGSAIDVCFAPRWLPLSEPTGGVDGINSPADKEITQSESVCGLISNHTSGVSRLSVKRSQFLD